MFNTYYYTLKNGNKLWYAVKGQYKHPETAEGNRCQGESRSIVTGEYLISTLPERKTEYIDLHQKDDYIETIKHLHQKIKADREDLKCQYCEKMYIWLGYHVWVEKKIAEAKYIDMGGLGKVQLGSNTKKVIDKWFNKKGKQKKFIDKLLNEDR
jgi:hypothetical protein